MLKIEPTARVAVVASHEPRDTTGFDYVIQCNANDPQSKCDLRVIGGDCDLSQCWPTQLAVNVALSGHTQNDLPWTFNHGTKNKMHLWVDGYGIVNTFDYVPVTGIVALQIALILGARDITAIGFDFFGNAEKVQTHYLPPQREYFAELLKTGLVRHHP